MTRFGEESEAITIGFELHLDLLVGGHSHLHLHGVVVETVLVGLIDCGGGRAVELLLVLGSQLRIFGFFRFDNLFASINHIRVNDLGLLSSSDGLGEVLSGSLLLELLNLAPNVIGDISSCRQGVKGTW